MTRARTVLACRAGLLAGLLSGLAGCAHGEAAAGAEGTGVQARRTTRPSRFASPYAYEWFVRAELLRAHGELAAAERAYRMALASADEDPYVLARLSTLLDERGKRAAGEAVLDDALSLDPLSEAAWLARAELAARHGELGGAVLAYERAETAAPSSARAPLALAALLRNHGDDERAIAVLERFEARTLPGSAGAARARLHLALSRRDASGAYRAAEQLLQTRSGGHDELLRTAQALLDAGEPVLAARLLAALPPHEDQSRLRLRVLLACGERAAAEALLEVSDPDVFGGLLATAEAYLQLDRAERALELAESVLATAHERDDARLLLARAQLGLGEHAAAAESFARIAPASPLAAEARDGLSRALGAENLEALGRAVAAQPAERAQ